MHYPQHRERCDTGKQYIWEASLPYPQSLLLPLLPKVLGTTWELACLRPGCCPSVAALVGCLELLWLHREMLPIALPPPKPLLSGWPGFVCLQPKRSSLHLHHFAFVPGREQQN